MLLSTVELALTTSSNSLFAFIFCNLIILMILLGSKFSSSNSETQDALPELRRYRNAKTAEIVDVEWRSDRIEHMSRPEKQAEEKPSLVKVSDVCNREINEKQEGQWGKGCRYEQEDENEEYNNEAENEENEEESNGDDDDLRRRIEDFIAKVNREWTKENLTDRKLKLTLLDQPLDWITQKA